MATPQVYEPKRLILTRRLPSVDTTLYTSPPNYSGTQITTIILTNSSTSAVTATLWLVEMGSQSDDNHLLLNAANIPTDGTPLVLEFDQLYMNPFDSIRGQASIQDRVIINVAGVELAATSTSTSTSSTSTSTTSTSSSTSTTTTA